VPQWLNDIVLAREHHCCVPAITLPTLTVTYTNWRLIIRLAGQLCQLVLFGFCIRLCTLFSLLGQEVNARDTEL